MNPRVRGKAFPFRWITASTRDVLVDRVTTGKPLLIAHAGLGAWPEWETYRKWCGYIWEGGVSHHPHEAADLQPTEGDFPEFGWHSAWLPRDEVFVALKNTAPVEVGLTAVISTGTFPAAWRSKQHPNVGVWMPGHRRDSWNIPAMREGAARCLLKTVSIDAGSRSSTR